MKRLALLLAFLPGCVTAPAPRPPPPGPLPEAPRGSEARRTLEAFLGAALARRFDEVLPLLARPLRERYGTAERLAQDFVADPVAAERLAGARRAAASLEASANEARLEWAPGRVLRLVREPEGWRVATLD